jgi:hypothetical protein
LLTVQRESLVSLRFAREAVAMNNFLLRRVSGLSPVRRGWRGHVPETFGQLAVGSAGVDRLVLEGPSVSADAVA